MSKASRRIILLGLVAALPGCTYDYLQRSDRVAYSAGDAVRANLERETSNPSGTNHYRTDGLGKNGGIVSHDPIGTTPVL